MLLIPPPLPSLLLLFGPVEIPLPELLAPWDRVEPPSPVPAGLKNAASMPPNPPKEKEERPALQEAWDGKLAPAVSSVAHACMASGGAPLVWQHPV